MINIKAQKDYQVALESVAMTDIVLNMFIFFFISFSILYTFNPIRVSKLDIKLPHAGSAVALEGSDKIILSISRTGGYFIDDEKVAGNNLKASLGARLKETHSAGLLLKVDSYARFNDVSKALDVINELNIKKVSVATVKTGK